jgi:hypothetical protein
MAWPGSYRLNGYLKAAFSIAEKIVEKPTDMTRYITVMTI